MAIREATVDDVDAIQEVARESWTADYPDILSRESMQDGFDEWYSDERIRDSIVWARAFIVVAERDDAIVGFAHATMDSNEEEGNVLRVYVEPDSRGDGLGGRLLEETCRTLFDRDVDRIKAMVLEANDVGQAFYDDFGFEKTETTTVTIGDDTYEECTYALDRDAAPSDLEEG